MVKGLSRFLTKFIIIQLEDIERATFENIGEEIQD